MPNMGGGGPLQGPLVHGLTIAFNMSAPQTIFVSRLVLLIWRSRGVLGGGGGGGVKPHRSAPPVGGEQSTQKKSGCGRNAQKGRNG